MDTYPITARSLGLYFKVDGNNLERAYKDHLSGFRNWEQASHAEDWVLHPKNIGKRLGIDETMLHKDLMTFLTNKEGHGKRHTLIAAVKGTKASDIINVLMQIPQEQREQVEEVTMDFSDSMFAVVTEAFPNAAIVIDCFHIVKRCIEAVEELRLKAKREAQKAQNKEKAMFKKKLEQLVLPQETSKEIQRQEAGTQATEVEQTLQANHACQWRNCHRTADKKQVSAECEW